MECNWDRCHPVDERRGQRYCKECRCKAAHDAAVKRERRAASGEDQPLSVILDRLQKKLEEARQRRDVTEYIYQNCSFAMFDIETTDLNANYGQLICACIKPLGKKTEVIVADKASDRDAAVAIRDALEQYDYFVTWYGKGFDVPFLNTRLAIHGERPLNPFRHVDLYYTARRVFKLNSNRLDVAAEAILGKTDKTRIRSGIWQAAMRGEQAALDYIVDHCVKDVKDLEKLFKRLYIFCNLASTPVQAFA